MNEEVARYCQKNEEGMRYEWKDEKVGWISEDQSRLEEEVVVEVEEAHPYPSC